MRAYGRMAAIAIVPWLAVVFAGAAALAQSTASLPAQRAVPGGDVVVPVVLTPADGVSTMDFAVIYDPAVVAPSGAFTTGFTGGYGIVPKLEKPNRVRLSLAGPVLTGAGEVAWVTFHAAAPAPASSSLGWGLCSLNSGGIPCATTNGTIDVGTSAVTVYMPDDAHAAPGSSVSFPISATAFSGVESIDLTLDFDPGVLAATSVSKTALTSGMTLTANLATPGVVKISLFGTSAISGSGPLLGVTFQVVGGLSRRTPLDLRSVLLNEGSPSARADDGTFLACTTTDGDGDHQSSCDGDCDDTNPAIYAGAVEVCDGVDNDCNGFVDDAAVPGPPSLSASKLGTTITLAWSGVYLATAYDAVRGGLAPLRASAGDFTAATDACVANDTTATTVEDADAPPPGDGFWYVVRAVNCGGAGTYDDGSARLAASRDAGITGAPASCP